MSNTDDPSAPISEAQSLRRLLMKIADVLQCPVSDLFSPDPAAALGDAAELVRLWHVTTDRQGRQRILAVARQEAARGADDIGCSPAP